MHLQSPGPSEVLKTSACGLGPQHLRREHAAVNALKKHADPYIVALQFCLIIVLQCGNINFPTLDGDWQ